MNQQELVQALAASLLDTPDFCPSSLPTFEQQIPMLRLGFTQNSQSSHFENIQRTQGV